MSVARCRFWKAIFFELLDQLLLPFISFFYALHRYSLYCCKEFHAIARNKVFRCLSKHNFKSLCFHHYNIRPHITRQHENIFIIQTCP